MMLLIRILHFVASRCYDNNFCGKVCTWQCTYAQVRNIHIVAFYDVSNICCLSQGNVKIKM